MDSFRKYRKESGLRHKGYVIYHDEVEFVAEPEEAESPVMEMGGGTSVDRLMRAIDQLWDALAGVGPTPVWYMDWMRSEAGGRIRLPRLEVPITSLLNIQTIHVTHVTREVRAEARVRAGVFKTWRGYTPDTRKSILPIRHQLKPADHIEFHRRIGSLEFEAASKIIPMGSFMRGISKSMIKEALKIMEIAEKETSKDTTILGPRNSFPEFRLPG